eukprot:IDg656t1
MQEVAEFTDRVWFAVHKLKDIREVSEKFEVLVSWKGPSTAGDSWEPLQIMYEDVPAKALTVLSITHTPSESPIDFTLATGCCTFPGAFYAFHRRRV